MGQRLVRTTPFTEIVERVQDLSRSSVDTKTRIRGLVNDIYTKEIPRIYDWPFLKTSSAISCVAQFNSGVASVITQSNIVSIGSASLSSSTNGRKIYFNGNNNVYDFTYTDSTGGTIAPSLSGLANVDSGTYTIFKNIYSLPSDFDRWPINGGLLYMIAGQPKPLPERIDDDYYADYTVNPVSQPDYLRQLAYDNSGCLQFEIVPPPSEPIVLQNEYIRSLLPMNENTAGSVTITSGGTAVTGTNTQFTMSKTGDYLRVDGFGKGGDSEWYRIASITNDASLTLATSFRSNSSVSVSPFTICSAPEYPYQLQDALIYGSMEKIFTDQNDPNFVSAHVKYAQILTDNKILINTRKSKDTMELIAEDYDYRW